MKTWKHIILASGIATCLIGAYLMAFGEPILGLNHTGIATVMGITGIGIITTANKTPFLGKKEEK